METVLSSRTREVSISNERPFAIIGERINPTGRRVLEAEMKAGVMDRVRADAAAQARAGAVVLDVNAGIPGVDEPALLAATIRAVMEVSDAPLCIDSSSIEALAAGLAVCEGKALLNSVNAEEHRMERIFPLVKKYGAAVIGMTSDETGISMVPSERLELARRIVNRATDHGIEPEDVIIDPIALSAAAGRTYREVTLETIRLVRDELGCNITCGLSNVSFGMRGRAAVNAAFLPKAMESGLTCAIANPLEPEVWNAVFAGDLVLGRERRDSE